MTRDELTEMIRTNRAARGITWQQLADAMDAPPVWATAALLGQHPIGADAARAAAELLALPAEAIPVLGMVPLRGAGAATPPSDPTIYRFHEALAVYGPALKELIHEQFGDGIMSAINFGLTLEKKPHPGGDRVVVTFDGKFLPYDWTFADGEQAG